MGINDFYKVGDKLKACRVKRKLTQQAMASVLNIPRTTYANYENNTREPSIEFLTLFSDFFDISLDELLFCNTKFDFMMYFKSVMVGIGFHVESCTIENVEIVKVSNGSDIYNIPSIDIKSISNNINDFLLLKANALLDNKYLGNN